MRTLETVTFQCVSLYLMQGDCDLYWCTFTSLSDQWLIHCDEPPADIWLWSFTLQNILWLSQNVMMQPWMISRSFVLRYLSTDKENQLTNECFIWNLHTLAELSFTLYTVKWVQWFLKPQRHVVSKQFKEYSARQQISNREEPKQQQSDKAVPPNSVFMQTWSKTDKSCCSNLDELILTQICFLCCDSFLVLWTFLHFSNFQKLCNLELI